MKLSLIKGFPKKKENNENMENFYPYSLVYQCKKGFNQCLDLVGEKEIGMDKEKLINCIWIEFKRLPGIPSAEAIADAIISSDILVVKDGK